MSNTNTASATALAGVALALTATNTASAAVDAGGLTITPVAKDAAAPKAPSKAEISRGIMKTLHAEGKGYEDIIAAMIAANGYDRQLARGTYKANFAKAGVPAPVEGTKPTKKATAPAATTETAPVAASTEVKTDEAPASNEAPAVESTGEVQGE